MINKQLSRKLLLMWSHSLITSIYENASATATLILSYYLKADAINSWIKNEWKSSWTILRKLQSSISFKLQILSISLRVML